MSQQNSSKPDIRLVWDIRDLETFQVEITSSDDDLIYHFWPPGQDEDFSESFGTELQDAFRHAFRKHPKDAEGFPDVDIQADYTSLGDSKTKLALDVGIPVKASHPSDQAAVALATFHVKVVGWASNPMADQYLKDDLLSHLDKKVKANHVPQEDDQLRRPDPEPERDRSRRGRRRRGKRNGLR